MKYTKTAVAAAVATGFAMAPMMASAETTLSGILEIQLSGVESDNDDAQRDVSVTAGDVRVAVNSQHEIAGGLIGYGNIQFNLDDLTGEGGLSAATLEPDENPDLNDEDFVEANSSATVASDDIYVGIKGGFGDIRIGDIPLAIEYGQLANDIHDVGTTVPGGLSYTGSFGGFGIGLNVSPEDDSDMYGVGLSFNLAGFGIGVGFEERADSAAYAVGATYGIAGFSLAAHYYANENNFDPSINIDTSDDAPDDEDTFANFSIDDTEGYAVQVGYSIAGVALGVTYAAIEVKDFTVDTGDAGVSGDEFILSSDESVIRLDAGYDLGGGTVISTRVQNVMDDTDGADSDNDLLEYRVQLAKTF